MGPVRKKSKPNPVVSTTSSTPANQQPRPSEATTPAPVAAPSSAPAPSAPSAPPSAPSSAPSAAAQLKDTPSPTTPSPSTSPPTSIPPDPDSASIKTRTSRASTWYNGGSWRAKASPVAQATRESISVAGGATSEALADGASKAGRYMHNSLKRASKSIPSAASESRIHATATAAASDSNLDKTVEPKLQPQPQPQPQQPKVPPADDNDNGNDSRLNKKLPPSSSDPALPKDPPLPPDPLKDGASQPDPAHPPAASQKGWWGWWSRPDGYQNDPEKSNHSNPDNPSQPSMTEAASTPLPQTPAVTPAVTPAADVDRQLPAAPIHINTTDTSNSNSNSIATATTTTTTNTSNNVTDNSNPNPNPNTNTDFGSTRSWFGLWSSAQNTQAQQQDNSPTHPRNHSPPDAIQSPTLPEPDFQTAPHPTQSPTDDTPSTDGSPKPKSSGWAFWSREKRKEDAPTPGGTQTQVGELAVADTPSQSHPEAAQFNQEREQKSKATHMSRTASLKEQAGPRSTVKPKHPSTPVTPSNSPPRTRPATPEPARALELAKAVADKSTKSSARPPNMVVPSFNDTYSPAYIPSYWERVTHYVASSLKLINVPGPQKHVAIAPTLPKVKTAVAIGVHGYFPAPLIQKVLGPPTGTSIRFANYASAAVRTWAEHNQPDVPCEIETVALEGEGFIADRVNTLWKLLLNWLSHLRQADLIYVACHSQGVPVAIMLLSKLIQLGCLSPNARIGVCAMAGVNLGPFADYKSRLLGAGSAAELFEFSRPATKVSKEYAHALDVVLRHGVRITYVGSIDDQLVSLESSTFSTLTHPYVYRCVFVDGRIHAPDFITHLVAFALRLRNLGISDHGLIRELSLPLAGSLYGGQGHSTVYDDPAVYKLALQFTLETTDVAPSRADATPPINPLKQTPQPQPEDPQARRSSRAGPPSSLTTANAIRRGSASTSSTQENCGIPPLLAPFELPASGSNANPYFLPWALRGILEEDIVKRDMGHEVQELVKLYEEWRPVSKVLKDVRFRLEGVRSKL